MVSRSILFDSFIYVSYCTHYHWIDDGRYMSIRKSEFLIGRSYPPVSFCIYCNAEWCFNHYFIIRLMIAHIIVTHTIHSHQTTNFSTHLLANLFSSLSKSSSLKAWKSWRCAFMSSLWFFISDFTSLIASDIVCISFSISGILSILFIFLRL